MRSYQSPQDSVRLTKKTGGTSEERNQVRAAERYRLCLKGAVPSRHCLDANWPLQRRGVGRRGSKAGKPAYFLFKLMQTHDTTCDRLQVGNSQSKAFLPWGWNSAVGSCANPAIRGKLGMHFLIPGES